LLLLCHIIAQGLDWVAKNHIKPAIVHMSIEGGFSSLVNKAVEQLIKTRHVHVVVSAGGCSELFLLLSAIIANRCLQLAVRGEERQGHQAINSLIN
jgi:hypothetical protein